MGTAVHMLHMETRRNSQLTVQALNSCNGDPQHFEKNSRLKIGMESFRLQNGCYVQVTNASFSAGDHPDLGVTDLKRITCQLPICRPDLASVEGWSNLEKVMWRPLSNLHF